MIQTIFETLTDFFETPKVLRQHLPILSEAAINISLNTDMQINVRSTTIFFLEQIGDTFGRSLAKKNVELLRKIIECGFRIACEDTEEYPDEEESPHYLALCMLFNFAAEVPNEVVYPVFKQSILAFCANEADPLVRKAGVKILGHVCESDALLDCIKDDIETWTDLIVKSLVDQDVVVREAACLGVGEFSESVVPDFLEQHEKVMPVLLQVLSGLLETSTQSEDTASSTERAIYALAEFAAAMEATEVKGYLQQSVQLCLEYVGGQGQRRGVRYQALNALSSLISAAEESIMPYRDNLLEVFYAIVKNSTSSTEQLVRGKALMCAGNLAQACGQANFPQEALEIFTKFGLECIQ